MMKTFINAVTKIYLLFEKALSYLQSPLLLAIRLYWGWQFFQSGLGKLKGIDKVIDFFTSLGIPNPVFTAHFVGGLECIGGALLFLGLGSRLISLPLTINMFVAYVTADREALLSFFSDPGKFYAADPFTFLLASLLILVFGPGKISVDAGIGYLWKRRIRSIQPPRESAASIA
jgi:putative oxidoreductase